MGLAEPRRKQRISIDPQNKNWEKDDDKFGKKMMEKMGWTEGKGLGLRLDGEQTTIKVTKNPTTQGLGHTKKHASEECYQQLIQFENVLSRLNDVKETDAKNRKKNKKIKKDKKIPIKEKTAPARLSHRRRNIKNKQISTYSKEELREILGV